MHAYSLGPERVEDVMEMVRIAGGLTHEEFDATPRMYTNINSTSPLKHDWPMLDGAMRLAARAAGGRDAVHAGRRDGAGDDGGAVAQSIAEALAAIALLQCVNPGVGVGIGTFTSNVDMKTGAPAFGTPEYMRATQITGPDGAVLRAAAAGSSNTCAANVPDGQAMWESNVALGGGHLGDQHGLPRRRLAGGGLCASFEKFVMDCEVLQQFIALHEPR
jgi:trimethylamine--corrinoid protein Co-methyltransferase